MVERPRALSSANAAWPQRKRADMAPSPHEESEGGREKKERAMALLALLATKLAAGKVAGRFLEFPWPRRRREEEEESAAAFLLVLADWTSIIMIKFDSFGDGIRNSICIVDYLGRQLISCDLWLWLHIMDSNDQQ